MNAVKQYFLEQQNQKTRKESETRRIGEEYRRTPNYKDAEHIGILFFTRNDQMHKFINQFYEKIKADKKEFTALTFDDDARQNPYIFKYSFFKKSDIGLLGKIKPKAKEVEQFINTEFDYLYCITVEEDIDMFDQILAQSKAKCRVGNYREDKYHLYEMMIRLSSDSDIDKLIHEMLKRTQAIRYN